MLSHTSLRVAGSNPVVGSSRNNTSGLFNNAAAISQRLFCPPDRFSYLLLHTSCSCSLSHSSVTCSLNEFLFSPKRAPLTYRFSFTVNLSSRQLFCQTTPILFLICASSLPARQPSITISPAVGRNKVHIILIVVDLPAPFTPRNPNNSPLSTEKLILSTAFTSLKYFFKFSTFMIASILYPLPSPFLQHRRKNSLPQSNCGKLLILNGKM